MIKRIWTWWQNYLCVITSPIIIFGTCCLIKTFILSGDLGVVLFIPKVLTFHTFFSNVFLKLI